MSGTSLDQAVLRGHRIGVSAITYSEMRCSATGPKSSPRHVHLVEEFCARLNAVLPRDRAAVDATTEIKVALRLAGTPIGPNDTAIAGHAIAAGAVLVTNNVREFERVPGLVLEDWVN
ncbi:type II toxin-antitoxin system VapC family toxin [Cronobacter dublinensis]|uniref:type II toxin-antitoxin system VapC family toxin n=1 Tax=Cronobacter dublinensis TaxID=413497 RepID=UPI003AB9AB69